MSSSVSHTINDYESLLVALQNVLGVVVPEGHRSNLMERIAPVLSSNKIDTFVALAKKLQADEAGEIKSEVLDVISQRQTSWFLSPDMKKVLCGYVLAQLPGDARIWVVGCGQGQLAYALAMEVAEYSNRTDDAKKMQIVATDGSAENIKQAEAGIYTENQLNSLSAEYMKLYTTRTNNGENYQLKNRVRELVSFKQCDLTENFQSMGKMDLIICPDALVYFSSGIKKNILHQFAALLKSGGIFLTGNNQAMIPKAEGFERVNHSAGVFYRKIF